MALSSRIGDFVESTILYRRTPPAEEASMAEEARRVTARVTRALACVAGLVGLLWWPFDLVIYRDQPEVIRAFAVWRSAVVLYCAVHYFTCDAFELLRRHSALWAGTTGCSITFFVAYTLGGLPSSDTVWFTSLHFAPIMTIAFLVTPAIRLTATTAIAAAALVGYFGLHPESRGHSGAATAIGLMAFSVAVAVFAGHAVYHLFRINRTQSLQLERHSAELELLSASLAERVQARTDDLRRLTRHIDQLRENERRLVASELHDELGQMLTGLRMEVDLAERVRARGGEVRPHLVTLSELVDLTLTSARSLLTHLRPRVLDDFGLVAALEWLVSDTRRRSGIDVSFEDRPEAVTLDSEVASGVFRIAQEALTNVLRHANATRATLRLTESADAITLRVEDDGRGLPNRPARPDAFGLLGMRERAVGLGGALELTPRTGGGTVVTLTIPTNARRQSSQKPALAISEAS